ncbi:MAG TPA: hypothetical protein VGM53_15725 [Streptosporangiaceae bacterium]|jgi:hypothetical protein
MSEEPAESGISELLRAAGTVAMPEPSVLQEAREALWSAIASEMLGLGSADARTAANRGTAAGEEDHRRTARWRRTDRPPDEGRKSLGGGDPDS